MDRRTFVQTLSPLRQRGHLSPVLTPKWPPVPAPAQTGPLAAGRFFRGSQKAQLTKP